MDYFADNFALTALSNDMISLNAYKTISNVPEYGNMLKAFCMFYNSLINDNNRLILDNYIAQHFSTFNLKYKMLLILCKHAPSENIETYLDTLGPILAVLNVNKSDGVEKIKQVLNANFSKILNLLEEKQSSIENILTNGFSSIKNKLTVKGGSKKNKRKYKRTRRVRKLFRF